MIDTVKGDVTYPIGDGLKIIAHICNDKGGWGAGVVLAISKRWSRPEMHYRSLKQYQLGKTYLINVEPDIVVANMIAQRGFYKPGYIPLDYDALTTCLVNLNKYAAATGMKIHMPKIGCGLGGSSWDIISKIVEETAKVQIFVYEF